QLVPERLAEGGPSHVARAGTRLRVVAPREIGARASPGQVIPAVAPGSLDGQTDEGIVGGIGNEAEDPTPERRQAHPCYPSAAARAPRSQSVKCNLLCCGFTHNIVSPQRTNRRRSGR